MSLPETVQGCPPTLMLMSLAAKFFDVGSLIFRSNVEPDKERA